ncbi:MAG: heme biosynthesis HemY N-terminal domain-containing protein [Rhodospirillaceae bacterium]
MTRAIFYFVVLAASVSISVWFADAPGVVELEWHGWRVDTSVAVLLILTTVIFSTMAFLVLACRTLLGVGRSFSAAKKSLRFSRGLDALAHGFAAVHGGDFLAAMTASRKARSELGDIKATRFLQQQASQSSKNNGLASAKTGELLEDPALELAILRDLAECALKTGDKKIALEYAGQALDSKRSPMWARSLALDLNIALGRWDYAANLFSLEDLQELVGAAAASKLKAALYVYAAKGAIATHDKRNALKWAHNALAIEPYRADAIAELGRALIALGRERKAATELERAWAKNPHPLILSAYLEIDPSESNLCRASRVKNLVASQPDHPESRLALANVSLSAELWGQARNRLEPLLNEGTAMHVRIRAAALMAQVDLVEENINPSAKKSIMRALEALNVERTPMRPTSVADLLS